MDNSYLRLKDATIVWITFADEIKRIFKTILEDGTVYLPIKVRDVRVGWRTDKITEFPIVEIHYYLEKEGVRLEQFFDFIQLIFSLPDLYEADEYDLELDKDSFWYRINREKTLESLTMGSREISGADGVLWFQPIPYTDEEWSKISTDEYKIQECNEDRELHEEFSSEQEDTQEEWQVIEDDELHSDEELNQELTPAEGSLIEEEPEENLVEFEDLNPSVDFVTVYNDFSLGLFDTFRVGVKRVNTVWNCTVEDIKVIKRRSLYNDYYLIATIGGVKYGTWIGEIIEFYLKRDKSGYFTRLISKEMLVSACFKQQLVDHAVIKNNLITYLGNKVEFIKGDSPVFAPDMDFAFTEEGKSMEVPQEANIISQNGVYYLNTYIGDKKMTVMLEQNFPDEYFKVDEDGKQPNYAASDDFLEYLIKYYFGHDILWIKAGKADVRQKERVGLLNDYPQPYHLISMMPESKRDYSQYILPKGYTIKDICLTYNSSKLEYTVKGVIRGEITKKSNNGWKKRNGMLFHSVVSDEDMANFLERDELGDFSCRVTKEQLACKYGMIYISQFNGVMAMQKAGIPATIMERATGLTKTVLEKYLSEYGYHRNGWAKISFIDEKKRNEIIRQYNKGCSLSVLKKKCKFEDYSLLYSILKKAMNNSYILPDDLSIEDSQMAIYRENLLYWNGIITGQTGKENRESSDVKEL